MTSENLVGISKEHVKKPMFTIFSLKSVNHDSARFAHFGQNAVRHCMQANQSRTSFEFLILPDIVFTKQIPQNSLLVNLLKQ